MPQDERTPLLWSYPEPPHIESHHNDSEAIDYHAQFCALVGVPSTRTTGPKAKPNLSKTALYARATAQLRNQRRVYNFSALINNGLLLTQVVLGAALTALGAAKYDHVLIAIFGAMNTIIAGIVAYLKSRGQPMRARMYRDDLERVVDEIENSEIMWRGITSNVHGYTDIDIDDVTVRSEVARLTRLYDRAVRTNTSNNPDLYMANGNYDSTFRPHMLATQPTAPIVAPVATPAPVATLDAAPAPAAPAKPPSPVADPDASPATSSTKKDPTPKAGDSSPKDDSKDKGKAPDATAPAAGNDTSAPASTPAPAPAPAPPVAAPAPPIDPDASPATAVLKRKTTNTSTKDSSKESDKPKEVEDKPKKVAGGDDD